MNAEPSQFRILNVDDNAAALYARSRILRQAGYEVAEAVDGRTAAFMVEESPPDLVLLDLSLPDMPGSELCARIKARFGSTVLILAVSAVLTERRHRTGALEAGADGYLGVPFEDDELLAQVGSLMRLAAAERTLRQERAKFRSLFEESGDAIIIADMMTRRYVDCNAQAERLTGYSRTELLTMAIGDLTAAPDRAAVGTMLNAIAETGRARNDVVLRTKDGGTVAVEINARVAKAGGGAWVHAVLRDIDERRRREEALSADERRYRALFEDCGDPILVIDAETGAYVDCNRAMETLSGYARDELLVLRRGALTPPEHQADFAAQFRALMERGTLRSQHVIRSKDGRHITVEASSRLLDIGGRRTVQIVSRDVSERNRMEAALRQSEATLRGFFEAAGVYMTLVELADDDLIYTHVSRDSAAFLGRPAAQLEGLGLRDVGYPEDEVRRRVALHRKVWESGAPFTLEYPVTHQGRDCWFFGTVSPIPAGSSGRPRFAVVATDITERKRMEEMLRENEARLAAMVAERTQELEAANRSLIEEIGQRARAEAALMQAQKMDALGKLTGGVAHDFNNLLQVIAGNLQLLGRDVGDERSARRVQNALSGVDRGAKLAAQLLAFARRQPLEPRVVNLERVVREMDDMLRRALGEAVEVETVVAGGLWRTLVDPAQFENALLNLAVNARDAMDGRGRLTIELGNAHLDDRYAAVHAEVTPGQYVLLAVTDTGCGMAPETVDRVFEPFFSTKPEGRGTGLGLSMVYGFAKQSGGHVKIYSELGHGTTVRLYLPRSHQAEEHLPDVESFSVAGGHETILVVEDDAEVRATVAETLAGLGYRVIEAPEAQAALELLRRHRVDLLFTDVVMPGTLRSPDLAREAQALQPWIRVLFTSGYTENAIVHGGRLDPGVHLLSKPYRREDLARKIRLVLSLGPDARPGGLAAS